MHTLFQIYQHSNARDTQCSELYLSILLEKNTAQSIFAATAIIVTINISSRKYATLQHHLVTRVVISGRLVFAQHVRTSNGEKVTAMVFCYTSVTIPRDLFFTLYVTAVRPSVRHLLTVSHYRVGVSSSNLHLGRLTTHTRINQLEHTPTDHTLFIAPFSFRCCRVFLHLSVCPFGMINRSRSVARLCCPSCLRNNADSTQIVSRYQI